MCVCVCVCVCVWYCTYAYEKCFAPSVPLPPMNVEVFNVSSKSLNVTWDKPMFVHGILLAYEVSTELLYEWVGGLCARR